MIKYLTKENVTLFLSILSIILSLISFARLLINEHVKLDIRYISHFLYERDGKTKLYLFMTFTNKSRLTVSISSAFLEISNQKYQFEFMPTEVFTETNRVGKEIIDRRVTYTISMPQTLLGLGVLGGYFGVETDLTDQFINENSITKLIIHTNKKILKYPVVLSKSEKV